MTGKRISVGYTLWPASFELTEPGPMLDEAEALGVDTVEIPLFTTRLIVGGRVQDKAVAWFTGHTAGRALGYTTHAMLTINLMDEPHRLAEHEAVARANIELSARIGARRLVLHCGLTAEQEPKAIEEAYARQRDCLHRLAEFAACHDVVICLETIWSFDGRETALPGKLADEVRAVGHDHLRVTLDFAHSALQCGLRGADLEEEVRRIAPLSPHLHLNDCFGIEKDIAVALPAEASAYGTGDLHLPIGWGSLDWDALLGRPDYPEDTITLNQELHPGHWFALADDVREMRRLAALMERQTVA